MKIDRDSYPFPEKDYYRKYGLQYLFPPAADTDAEGIVPYEALIKAEHEICGEKDSYQGRESDM
ncbi:MAG: hypothetical protein IJX77_08935 [Ruminococcus sp.]|nr:hypothetical protein [Ruminococcus sp.]